MKSKKDCSIQDSGSSVIHPILKHYLTYRFYKTALRLRDEVNAALAPKGIIGPQLGILRILDSVGPHSQVQLGRSLGIDKATMVKLIDGLERPGFVRRVSLTGDRRVKRIQITADGVKQLRAGTKIRDGVESDFFSVLSQAEKASLDKILSKLTP